MASSAPKTQAPGQDQAQAEGNAATDLEAAIRAGDEGAVRTALAAGEDPRSVPLQLFPRVCFCC